MANWLAVVDSVTKRFPASTRQAIADDFGESTTEMGAALAEQIALQAPAGGGGGGVSRPYVSAVVYSAAYVKKPTADTANFVWVCDGTADEVEINAAINAVVTNGRGKVQLVGPGFHLSGSIVMKTGVWLAGEGLGTIIEADADFAGGMVQSFDNSMHATKLSDLSLDGNSHAVSGVFYDLAGGSSTWTSAPGTSPDTGNIVRDLYIYEVGSSTVATYGLHFTGGRANKYDNIRVLNASGCGVWVDGSVDSHYTNIEVGSSGDDALTYSDSTTAPVGHGFYFNGSNNMVNNCKAWYSRGAGFYIREARSQFSNCQTQDNYSHGFHCHFGDITMTGCFADSNGQGLGSATHGDGRAGFYFKYGSHMAVVGCQAADRGQAWQQQYGFQFAADVHDSAFVGCVTSANAVASQTGTPGTGNTIQIVADAGGK